MHVPSQRGWVNVKLWPCSQVKAEVSMHWRMIENCLSLSMFGRCLAIGGWFQWENIPCSSNMSINIRCPLKTGSVHCRFYCSWPLQSLWWGREHFLLVEGSCLIHEAHHASSMTSIASITITVWQDYKDWKHLLQICIALPKNCNPWFGSGFHKKMMWKV